MYQTSSCLYIPSSSHVGRGLNAVAAWLFRSNIVIC